MTPPTALSQRQGLCFESGKTRVLPVTTRVCTSAAEPFSEEVPQPSLQLAAVPLQIRGLKTEDVWLL